MSTDKHVPEVTIALLTLDAGPLLIRVLDALDAQDFDGAVERIALDSGSTDGTVERLEHAGFRIVPFCETPFDFGRAREQLYKEAGGSVVVNLSQDAVPADAHWLTRLTAPFDDPDVAVVCGGSVPDPERGFDPFIWERNGLFYFTSEIQRFVDRYGRGVSFSNSAVRRRVWEALHFDPIPLGEDFQFQKKLTETDWGIAFVDEADVLHHHNYTLGSLYARAWNEGLALRMLGMRYSLWNCLGDLARAPVWRAWLRSAVRGRLRSPAAWLFPWLRPVAVYHGSARGKQFRPFQPRTQSTAEHARD